MEERFSAVSSLPRHLGIEIQTCVLKSEAGSGVLSESSVTEMQRNTSLTHFASWVILLLCGIKLWLVAAE